MANDSPAASQVMTAWASWCDQLKASGRRLVDEDFPPSDRDVAEGFRNLGRLAVLGWLRNVEFNDAAFPAFLRVMDDVTQWGGPNPDNTYLRAVVHGDHEYRIVGNVGKLHDMIVSLHEGEFPLESIKLWGELRLSELAVDSSGDFEILISRRQPERDAPWLEVPAGAAWVNIRMYHYDWPADSPGWVRIDRLGGEGDVPEVITTDRLARQLAAAAALADDSLVYWKDFFHQRQRDARPNELSPPGSPPGGAHALAYGSGFWDLGPDEMLLIELQHPKASYWSLCAYDNERMQVPDWLWRQTSFNGAQAHEDDDGIIRIVVAHTDPGVPNWLDTTGYRTGWLSDRYIDVEELPRRTTRLLTAEQLRAALPASHPRFDAVMRNDQRARRQQAMARRFRH